MAKIVKPIDMQSDWEEAMPEGVNAHEAAKSAPSRLKIRLIGTEHLEYQFKFVTALMQSADNKINHFGSLRQRNLVIALGIFAGLFSLALNTKSETQAALTTPVLTIIMSFFWALDYLVSKYSHGWQRTRWYVRFSAVRSY